MVQYPNPYLTNPYLPLYNQGQPVMPQAMQHQQPVAAARGTAAVTR